VEFLKSAKKWQNPGDLGILDFLSDLKNSPFKYLYRPFEVPHFSRQGMPTQICTAMDGKTENVETLCMAFRGT
jgi:hypothetical protein